MLTYLELYHVSLFLCLMNHLRKVFGMTITFHFYTLTLNNKFTKFVDTYFACPPKTNIIIFKLTCVFKAILFEVIVLLTPVHYLKRLCYKDTFSIIYYCIYIVSKIKRFRSVYTHLFLFKYLFDRVNLAISRDILYCAF